MQRTVGVVLRLLLLLSTMLVACSRFSSVGGGVNLEGVFTSAGVRVGEREDGSL